MNLQPVKIGSREVQLPIWLSENQKNEIIEAVKERTPIIICGKQGPTGKSTLKELLTSQGFVAFEEWECVKITL